jgi:tRNA A37 threonylcarbamoyladenosine modification protein TsaB
MYLFIDTISPKNALFLTDEKNQVIQEYFFDVRLQESSRLIEEVDQFLKSLGVDYMSLKKIAVVN